MPRFLVPILCATLIPALPLGQEARIEYGGVAPPEASEPRIHTGNSQRTDADEATESVPTLGRAEAAQAEWMVTELTAELERLRGEIESAQGKLNGLNAEARSARKDAEAAKAELEQLKAALATGKAEEAALAERIEDLRGTLGLLEDEIGARRAQLLQVETSMEELHDTATALGKELAENTAEIESLAARRTDLLAEIRVLEEKARAAAISSPQAPVHQPPERNATTSQVAATRSIDRSQIQDTTETTRKPAPRRPGATVIAAMEAAPGLTGSSAEERAELTELLSDGTCVIDALRQVFGTVNRQSLVWLMRELDGC